MGRKSKSKRAGFRGTQFQTIVASRGTARDDPEASTSSGNAIDEVSEHSAEGQSGKKLSNAPSAWARTDAHETPSDGDFTPVFDTDPPTYRLMDLVELNQAISAFTICRSCKTGRVCIFEAEKDRRGFCSKLSLKCDSCSKSHNFHTSRLRPGVRGQSYDVNRRTALAALGTGANRAGFVRLAGVMNMPLPPLYDSWDIHLEDLSKSLGTVNRLYILFDLLVGKLI